jgi:hypothetical protein
MLWQAERSAPGAPQVQAGAPSDQAGNEIGLPGSAGRIRISSPTGSYAMATAEHREPCESRGSCTVLGAPRGEIPPGDSTKRAVMWLSGFEVGPTLRHATMGESVSFCREQMQQSLACNWVRLSGRPSSAGQLIAGLILLQSALRSSLVASALRRLSLFLLAAGCRQRSPQHFKNDGCGPAKQQHAVHCRHQPKQVPPLQRSHVAVAKRCGSLQRQSKQDQCQEIPMSEQANDQPSTSTRCEAIKTDAVALMTAVNRRD